MTWTEIVSVRQVSFKNKKVSCYRHICQITVNFSGWGECGEKWTFHLQIVLSEVCKLCGVFVVVFIAT